LVLFILFVRCCSIKGNRWTIATVGAKNIVMAHAKFLGSFVNGFFDGPHGFNGLVVVVSILLQLVLFVVGLCHGPGGAGVAGNAAATAVVAVGIFAVAVAAVGIFSTVAVAMVVVVVGIVVVGIFSVVVVLCFAVATAVVAVGTFFAVAVGGRIQ